jgi:hypothetical protein
MIANKMFEHLLLNDICLGDEGVEEELEEGQQLLVHVVLDLRCVCDRNV